MTGAHDELLPVFRGEPFASLLGVMRFPADMEKAEIYTCWALLRRPAPAGFELAEIGPIARRAALIAGIAKDVEHAEKAGTAVGSITACYFNLMNRTPEKASWDHATLIACNLGGITRADALRHRKDFAKVFHYWGVYYLNNCRWPAGFGDVMRQAEGVLALTREFGARQGSPRRAAFRWPIASPEAFIPTGNVPERLMVKRPPGRPAKNP